MRAKITSKGQITLPAALRRRLGLHTGDEVAFAVDADGARLLALKRRKLTDFFGALPATRPHKSLKEIRRELGRKLGEELDRRARAASERERRGGE